MSVWVHDDAKGIIGSGIGQSGSRKVIYNIKASLFYNILLICDCGHESSGLPSIQLSL